MSEGAPKKIVEAFEKYRFHFEKYVNEVMGMKLKGKQQREYADALDRILLAKHKLKICNDDGLDIEGIKRLFDTGVYPMSEQEFEDAQKKGISIMSGKGNGKDALGALTIHYLNACFSPVRMPCTAPKFTQLGDILWNEFKKWNNRKDGNGNYICKIHDKFEVLTETISCLDFKEEGCNFAAARVAQKECGDGDGTSLSGQHTTFLVPIIEEASKVRDPNFYALFNTLTEWGNFIIVIFNPNRTSGFAWETQYGKLRKYFICLQWNSEESEIYDPVMLQTMRDKYWPTWPKGEPHNEYRIYVQGLPPVSEEGALISFAKIYDAIVNDIEVDRDTTPIVIGIDPAGRGKANTSAAVRQGAKILELRTIPGVMPKEISKGLLQLFNEYDPDRVAVEIDGLGWSIYCELMDTCYANICSTFTAKGSSKYPDKWANKRTDTWFEVRDRFEAGSIDIPDDDELKEELKAMESIVNLNGKVGMIDKLALRARLGRSPDKADSVMVSFSVEDRHLPRRGAGWNYKKDDFDADETLEKNSWMAA